MIVPFSFAGGGFSASTFVREPSSPTRDASIWASPAESLSSCFFFAPMIALSEG
jgi:hypothetical protein